MRPLLATCAAASARMRREAGEVLCHSFSASSIEVDRRIKSNGTSYSTAGASGTILSIVVPVLGPMSRVAYGTGTSRMYQYVVHVPARTVHPYCSMKYTVVRRCP
jgi:hypothetical protein